MKKCNSCNKIKPIKDFYKNGYGKFRPECKECNKQKNNKKFKPKLCKLCGKEFIPCSSINIFCSKKCTIKNECNKRSKKPKTKICKHCNSEFTPYTSLNKFCSANCRINHKKSKRIKNWSEEKCNNIKGENNPAYRNGYYCMSKKKKSDGERRYIRNSKELKNHIIENSGYIKCENCNTSKSIKYETHHIIFRSEKPNHKNLHDLDNLILLCIECHNKFHKNKGLRNRIVVKRELHLLFGNDILDK